MKVGAETGNLYDRNDVLIVIWRELIPQPPVP